MCGQPALVHSRCKRSEALSWTHLDSKLRQKEYVEDPVFGKHLSLIIHMLSLGYIYESVRLVYPNGVMCIYVQRCNYLHETKIPSFIDAVDLQSLNSSGPKSFPRRAQLHLRSCLRDWW